MPDANVCGNALLVANLDMQAASPEAAKTATLIAIDLSSVRWIDGAVYPVRRDGR